VDVAALLGDRVIRAACIVGVAPFETFRDDWFSGMDPENVWEYGWALESEERLAAELELVDRQYRQQVATDPANALEGHQLPESDRAITVTVPIMNGG
jgi:hypothetical protein